MLLHLIRHGQTDWNAVRRIQGQTESELDDTGIAQAKALHEVLHDTPFVRAHVSSSIRTRQTAANVFAGRDIPMRFDDDLREMRLGVWETQLWGDVEESEPDTVALYQRFDDRFFVDGAERLSEMQQRGVRAVERIIGEEQASGTSASQHVAIVSHGFLLRAIFAHYLKLPLTAFAGSTGLPNCAHSILRADGDERELQMIASAPPREGLWSEIVAAGAG